MWSKQLVEFEEMWRLKIRELHDGDVNNEKIIVNGQWLEAGGHQGPEGTVGVSGQGI